MAKKSKQLEAKPAKGKAVKDKLIQENPNPRIPPSFGQTEPAEPRLIPQPRHEVPAVALSEPKTELIRRETQPVALPVVPAPIATPVIRSAGMPDTVVPGAKMHPAPLSREEYQEADIRALAATLTEELAEEMKLLRERMGMADAAWDSMLHPTPADAESFLQTAMRMRPETITSHTLSQIQEANPQAAVVLWYKIKKAALAELASGIRGGDAVINIHDLWQRARYQVLLTSLTESWQPINAIETSLIVQLAQTQIFMEQWMKRLNDYNYLLGMRKKDQTQADEEWGLPRVSDIEGVKLAADMVDRFNRQYLRIVRHLRDLRRYASPIVVHNAEQVNVGSQQVNVAQAVAAMQPVPP